MPPVEPKHCVAGYGGIQDGRDDRGRFAIQVNLKTTEHEYRPDIDGLRAVAVLTVVFFHAFPAYMPGGFVGVDVFFVISGFLISGIIIDELNRGAFSLRRFYARRARRIFPALILVLASVLIAGWIVLFPAEYARLGQQVAASAAFVPNIYLWSQSGYFNADANTYPLLHLWSLGVEEQFYVVWPLLLLALWRSPKWLLPAIILIGLGSFALNMALLNHRSAVFYLPFTRAWELMLGAALAYIQYTEYGPKHPKVTNELRTLIGLVLIACAVAFFNSGSAYPGWQALVPTIGAGLILWSGKDSYIGSRVLGSRVPVRIGLVSYPLYLWHWPALWLARTIDPASGAWTLAAMCGLSFVLAWLTYQLAERPIRRALASWSAIPAYLFGALAVAGVAGIVVSINGVPARWSKEVLAVLFFKTSTQTFLDEYRAGKCMLEPSRQRPDAFQAQCFSETVNAPRRMVLWGDSSAAALFPGLHQENARRFDIAELTSSGCPPYINGYDPSQKRYCQEINSFVRQYIETNRPDTVILSTFPDYPEDIPEQMRGTVVSLRETGIKNIFVIGPPPYWPASLPEMILRNYLGKPLKEIPDELELPSAERASLERLDAQLDRVVSSSGGTYVSSYRRLCTDGRCTVMVAGQPVAWDRFHFTLNGSALLARDIYSRLDPEPN
jgi:peptidoglycan/LPS O-acetylase OafA/YrhL